MVVKRSQKMADVILDTMPFPNRTASELRLAKLQKMLAELQATSTPCPESLLKFNPFERFKPNLVPGMKIQSRAICPDHNSQRMTVLPRSPPLKKNANETAKVLVSRGRLYGNLCSMQNAEQRRQVTPVEETNAGVSAGAGDSSELDYYNKIKNRLLMMEEQHRKMISIYGRDNFLEEFTELLQDCATFERNHRNLEPYAILKMNSIQMLHESSETANCSEKENTKQLKKSKRNVSRIHND